MKLRNPGKRRNPCFGRPGLAGRPGRRHCSAFLNQSGIDAASLRDGGRQPRHGRGGAGFPAGPMRTCCCASAKALPSSPSALHLARHRLGRSRLMRLGIDLGGTKTEIMALAPGGDVALRRRVATPRDYDGTAARRSRNWWRAPKANSARAAVSAWRFPAAKASARQLIKNANTTYLNGKPLRRGPGKGAGRARCGWPMTPIVLPCRKPATARRRARARCSASSPAPAWAAAW